MGKRKECGGRIQHSINICFLCTDFKFVSFTVSSVAERGIKMIRSMTLYRLTRNDGVECLTVRGDDNKRPGHFRYLVPVIDEIRHVDLAEFKEGGKTGRRSQEVYACHTYRKNVQGCGETSANVRN